MRATLIRQPECEFASSVSIGQEPVMDPTRINDSLQHWPPNMQCFASENDYTDAAWLWDTRPASSALAISLW